MTRAYFRDGETVEMRVIGHAGFAEQGKDPVCAGASVLAMTAAQAIQLMAEDGKLEEPPLVHVSGGNVRFRATPKREFLCEARHIMYVAEIGFLLLSGAYPEHVELKVDTGEEPEEMESST